MGVVPYQVTYGSLIKRDLSTPIDSILNALNESLSTYVPESEISEFNRTHQLSFRSPFFLPILEASKEIYQATAGAYDPTVGPLVNLWGFGPGKEGTLPDSLAINNALQQVGFRKIAYDAQTVSSNSEPYLDFSAIAKGYAVDLVAEYLYNVGVKDFYVEIGGEIRCAGKNPSNEIWKTGIYDPRVADVPDKQVAAIVSVENKAIATSGNYRNFYVKDGKKYAHTISPFTGYPVEHSLLSASVFADDCMTADAYATAFMVLGVAPSIKLAEANPQLDVHLIYADESGALQTYTSERIRNSIILE
ncbi:MAG: FAD:protein FMN transferase [Bacteroidota bacterium]